ncbi:protein kinase [Euzebya sp.]|uniref:protein kinase domain-containing protein n=1 Tax=Euzebya sp. TaxID=1971409 RepID=UPI0035142B75
MDDLRPGTRIGPYTIRQVAGRGAVGIVYMADHEVLDRRVAVKTLSPLYADEGVFRERFSREAQGAAAVRHPNIISVFDAGEHEGIPYLVMTYVDGPDLERVLSDRGGRLEPAEAVLICAAVADALDAAGAQGLAHRDVKPANILLEGWEPERYGGPRRRPHVYLTDFGLVRSSAQVTVTRTGQFVGTLLYMSPEQIESKAIPASDQYSLACVLWECLTGTFPFTPSGGSTLSLLSKHLNDPVPPFSAQPGGRWSPGLDAIFARALAKKPQDRFPTCGDFMDAVTRELGLGTSAPRSTPEPPVAALEGTGRSGSAPPPPAASATTSGVASAASGPPPPHAGAVPMDDTRPPPTAPGPAGPPGYPPGLPPGLPSPQAQAPPSPNRNGVIAAIAVVLLLLAAAIVAYLVATGDDDVSLSDEASAAEVAGDEVAEAAEPDGAVETTAAGDLVDDPATAGGDDGDTATAEGAAPEAQGLVAFVADGEVWAQATDGQAPVDVTAGRVPGAAQPAWRPGTDELVVASEAGLVLLGLDGGEPQPLTDDGGHSDPAWDPTGSQLVFSAPAADGARDLVVLELGAEPRPLGLPVLLAAQGGGTIAQRPTWSPDGGVVTFHVAGGPDGLRLWSVDPVSGPPEPVLGVAEGDAFHPAYTRAGDLVYSSRGDPSTDAAVVQVLELALATSRVVAQADGVDAKDADPSPCGDWIAYQVDLPEGPRIAVAPLDGAGDTAEIPLPEGVGAVTDPAWAGQACPA